MYSINHFYSANFGNVSGRIIHLMRHSTSKKITRLCYKTSNIIFSVKFVTKVYKVRGLSCVNSVANRPDVYQRKKFVRLNTTQIFNTYLMLTEHMFYWKFFMIVQKFSVNPDLSHMLIMRQSAEINSDNLNIANAFISRDS